MDDNAKELARRGDKLFARKQGLDALNQDIALNFYPERADFTTEHVWGDEFARHLSDEDPVRCRRDLCNSFSAMLRPRGMPWFAAKIDDDDLMEELPIQRLCEAITSIHRREIYRRTAQFSRATKEVDHDYGTFGNGGLWIGRNSLATGLLHRSYHLRDLAWVDGPDGEVNEGGAIWRKFKLSARNIKIAFPKAELHRSIIEALDKDPDREFNLCHTVLLADEYEYATKPDHGYMWASVYYDAEHKSLLRESGLDDFCYVIPRWHTLSGSPYAVSPAAIVGLPGARGLQTMARILLEAGEKTVDPPVIATEGSIKSEINLYSGGITWRDRRHDRQTQGDALEVIQLGKQVALGVEMLLQARESLRQTWYLNQLSLPTQGPERTATEMMQLYEEFIRRNIPLFEPIETTYNSPMLDLQFQLLDRMGAFLPAFRELKREAPDLYVAVQMHAKHNGQIEFAFNNPVQDAIEKNRVNQANILLGVAAGLDPIDPTAKTELDGPRILRDVGRGSGAPTEWLHDPRKSAAARAQMQQGGDIVAALGAAGQAADIANTGADAAQKLQQIGLIPGAEQGNAAAS